MKKLIDRIVALTLAIVILSGCWFAFVSSAEDASNVDPLNTAPLSTGNETLSVPVGNVPTPAPTDTAVPPVAEAPVTPELLPSDPPAVVDTPSEPIATDVSATAEIASQAPIETPVETVSQAPVETPVVETVSQAPAETPIETVSQAPVETPVETTSQAPVETPAETVSQAPVETPVETVTQAPVETPTETTSQAPVETPVETVSQAPTETPAETVSQAPTVSETPAAEQATATPVPFTSGYYRVAQDTRMYESAGKRGFLGHFDKKALIYASLVEIVEDTAYVRIYFDSPSLRNNKSSLIMGYVQYENLISLTPEEVKENQDTLKADSDARTVNQQKIPMISDDAFIPRETETTETAPTQSPALDASETPLITDSQSPALDASETPLITDSQSPALDASETPLIADSQSPALDVSETPATPAEDSSPSPDATALVSDPAQETAAPSPMESIVPTLSPDETVVSTDTIAPDASPETTDIAATDFITESPTPFPEETPTALPTDTPTPEPSPTPQIETLLFYPPVEAQAAFDEKGALITLQLNVAIPNADILSVTWQRSVPGVDDWQNIETQNGTSSLLIDATLDALKYSYRCKIICLLSADTTQDFTSVPEGYSYYSADVAALIQSGKIYDCTTLSVYEATGSLDQLIYDPLSMTVKDVSTGAILAHVDSQGSIFSCDTEEIVGFLDMNNSVITLNASLLHLE